MAMGKGCSCGAQSERHCCCGVDWRSEREVELEAKVKELEAENERLNQMSLDCMDEAGGQIEAREKLQAENERLKNCIRKLWNNPESHGGYIEDVRDIFTLYDMTQDEFDSNREG